MVLSIPFGGGAAGYEQESDAVQTLMNIVVPQEVTAEV